MYDHYLETLIFIPMFLLVFFTFFSLLKLAYARQKAVRAKEVPAGFFKNKIAKDGLVLSEKLVNLDNHFKNLFELPVLFYFAIITVVLIGKTDSVDVILAWCFLFFKITHSIIYLTYNNLTHRFIAFTITSISLLALWLNIFYNLLL